MKTKEKQKDSSLPESWQKKPLSDLATVIRGVTYKKADSSEKILTGYIPILRATNISDNQLLLEDKLIYVPKKFVSENQHLQPGDIVVATSSGSKHLVGKAAAVKSEWTGSFGAFCAAIRPNEGIDPRYLSYFFESPEYKKHISSKAMGVNINNLRRGDLEEMVVPVAPPNQQRSIVAEIEKQFFRLDEAVTSLKRAKANLKRYKAAVLKAAVEGKLTEEWRKQHPDVEPASELLKRILIERRRKWEEAELAKMHTKGKEPKDDKWKQRYKEPSKPITDELSILPNSWTWTSLIQLCYVNSGSTPKEIKNTNPGCVPWFKVGDMNTPGNEVFMRKAEVNINEEDANKLGLHLQPEGTFIFPKRGGAIATNKKRILGQPSYYDLNTMGITAAGISPNFFWNWLLTINLISLGDGSNVPQINHGDIEPLSVPLPPEEEQIIISDLLETSLSAVDAGTSIVENSFKRITNLRQIILIKAFNNEL
ncbi:MAG: restriction endonuclease subunit S [Thermoleophilia bacterium]